MSQGTGADHFYPAAMAWRWAPRGRLERRVGLVRVGSGPVRVATRGHGPPLLLVNGIGASIETWDPFESRLKGFTVISFDAPGLGESGHLHSLMPMRALAGLVVELLDSLGHNRVDVLGYSWGGALAQQLAYQAPERVRRLVLCGTTCGLGGVLGSPRALAALATPYWFHSPSHHRRAPRELDTGEGQPISGRLRPPGDPRPHRPPNLVGYAGQLLAIAGWTSLPWLHRIPQPTLVVAGDADPVVPLANAQLLARRIPDSRLHIVEGGGHLFLLEQAGAIVGLVQWFLRAPDGELAATTGTLPPTPRWAGLWRTRGWPTPRWRVMARRFSP